MNKDGTGGGSKNVGKEKNIGGIKNITCKYFQQDRCRYGDKCRFYHNQSDGVRDQRPAL